MRAWSNAGLMGKRERERVCVCNWDGRCFRGEIYWQLIDHCEQKGVKTEGAEMSKLKIQTSPVHIYGVAGTIMMDDGIRKPQSKYRCIKEL